MIVNGIDYPARIAALESVGVDPWGADTQFGVPWVHCNQHGRVHAPGWCSVSNVEKRPMQSPDEDGANAEARRLGLWFSDSEAGR